VKLRYRIATGFLLLLAIAVIGLAVVISYDTACTPLPAVAPDAETMQAASYTCYGGPEVLELAEVAKPIPAAGEVLVRVERAAVNPLDWHYLRGSPYIMRLGSGIGGPARPRLGVDFAGTVESVGAGVTRFRAGDRVFGGKFGAFAEYVAVDAEGSLVSLPPGLDFEQAAGVPIAALTALQALRDHGGVQPGQKVLINGASGGVGTFAVQIAKAIGAEVTGVCSTRNVELVRALGADHVIDYKQADYTRNGQRWDVIIDNVGNHSVLANRAVLSDTGIYVIVGGPGGDWLGPLLRPLWAMVVDPFVDQKLSMVMARQSRADLETLAQMLVAGQLRTVVDRRFALDDIAEAIRYSETGRARGKIIVQVPDAPGL
jgi:NADPH:quinone reductase-like Zn-dependent oxidoreductase